MRSRSNKLFNMRGRGYVIDIVIGILFFLSVVSFVVGLFMLDGKHSTTAKVLASVGGGVCLLVIGYLCYKYKQNA